MAVFVLLGQIDYEGQGLLGVYSTREGAVSAKELYVANGGSGDTQFDSYVIEKREMDVIALPDYAITDIVEYI
jgi:hypothetical protein